MKELKLLLTYKLDLFSNLITLLIIFVSSANMAVSQEERTNLPKCLSIDSIHFRHQQLMDLEFEKLELNESFKIRFEKEFSISYALFSQLNKLELTTIKKVISSEIQAGKSSIQNIKDELISKIKRFKDNFAFEPERDDRSDITRLGRHFYVPHHQDSAMWGAPKTLLCLNAGFEEATFNTWQTFCAEVNDQVAETINLTSYTPPANCPQPIGGIAQHAIVTGGIDPFSGFPRVFPGGSASALLGDFTGVDARASVIRKTFVVDSTNTLLRYSYMAVLENPVNHSPGEQPFFKARLYDQNGVSDSCASYDSYGGDGKPGWIVAGDIQYRDWTTILIPLENYIGQTVTLELATGDCFLTAHFGYAYVDVSCDNLEIERACVGVSTVLIAPANSGSYLWNTGETTSQITITSPGTYVCTITPFGSICSVDVTYEADLFPIPNVDFIPSSINVCEGDNVLFLDNTDTSSGSIISSYMWNFGDSISTPASIGTIVGVPQTSGTYTYANHLYLTAANPNVSLTVVTTDNCTVTVNQPITVNSIPSATILGSTQVCFNDASPVVTFTGVNGVEPYTFIYSMNGGPSQTITSVGNSAQLLVPTNIAGSITINLTQVNDAIGICGQQLSAAVTIEVNPLPTAQITGNAIVCLNDPSPIVSFTSTSPSSGFSFTYNINGGASQVISSSTSIVSINAPTDVAGTFVYNLVSVTELLNSCTQSINQSIEITVHPQPTATIIGSDTVCVNESQPLVTFIGSNGLAPYTFTYSIGAGANQTIVSIGNEATISVPTNLAGNFTYNLISVNDANGFCQQLQSGTVNIVVNQLPLALISGSATVCFNDIQPTVVFSSPNIYTPCAYTYSVNGGPSQTVVSSGSSSVTISAPTDVVGTFIYTLLNVEILETMCSQPQTQSISIVVNPIPTANSFGSQTVCQNSAQPQVVFTASNANPDFVFTYTINNGPPQSINSNGSNSVQINVSTAIEGTYIYELTNVSALCSQNLNLSETIIVNPLPMANISAPIDVCIGDDSLHYLTFTGSNGTAPYLFTYNVNGGVDQQISTQAGSDSVTILVPTNVLGNYVYTITNVQESGPTACKQDQNSISNVVVHALPIVYAGQDITICIDQEVVLYGTMIGICQCFGWNNGVLNGIPFVPNDTTIYTLTGIDTYGCSDTDNVVVFVAPLPVIDFEGFNLSGCAPLTSTFVNQTYGNSFGYIWNMQNESSIVQGDTVTLTFYESGSFDVNLAANSPEGCMAYLTLTDYITVYPDPDAAFSVSPNALSTYDWEAEMINQSSGAVSYTWDFGDGSAISTQTNPTHEFPNEIAGNYLIELVAQSELGCIDTAYQSITLTEELLFYVPNTFTPDFDQHNEVFKPVFSTGFDPTGYRLLIFNRWGEVVFESHDIDYGWNGYYKDLMCQDGTYTWKIVVKEKSSKKLKELVGHVNIIK